MTLDDLLTRRREAVCARCFHNVTGSYPAEASAFMKKEKDRFNNPVGHSLKSGVEALVEHITGWDDSEELPTAVVDMIKVRAIQEFSPSTALAFVLETRQAVREEAALLGDTAVGEEELADLDARLERTLLKAFDAYVACRERLFQAQLRSLRDRSFVAMRRLNRELEAESPEASEEDRTE